MAAEKSKKEKTSKKALSPENDNESINKKEESARTKEQISQLKKQKKEMEEELDELKGDTIGGKITAFFILLLLLFILLGGFVGLIKLNVGNFSSNVLAPIMSDIPVIKYVLPKDLQTQPTSTQTTSEAAAAKAASEKAAAKAASETAAKAASEAESKAASEAAASEAAAKAASETAASEAAAKAASEAAALKDYVDTYSKMDSKVAASVFDNMMANQSGLVVKILQNLTSQKRADIMSNMKVDNVSQLTVLMQQK